MIYLIKKMKERKASHEKQYPDKFALGRVLELDYFIDLFNGKRPIIAEKDEVVLRIKREDVRSPNEKYHYFYIFNGKSYIQDQLRQQLEGEWE